MGFLELTDVAYRLPGGWTLFEGVTFRVPEGAHSALVGANHYGAGISGSALSPMARRGS